MHRGNSQGVGVYIRVVSNQCCARNGQRRVFGYGDNIVDSYRRIVYRRNVDGNRVGRCIESATRILHREVECGIPHSICIGNWHETQISCVDIGKRDDLSSGHGYAAQAQASVNRKCVDAHCGKGLASVHVGEGKIRVGQGQDCIFKRRHGGICAVRRRIGANVDRHNTRCGPAISIADGIGDCGRTSEVQGRRKS